MVGEGGGRDNKTERQERDWEMEIVIYTKQYQILVSVKVHYIKVHIK